MAPAPIRRFYPRAGDARPPIHRPDVRALRVSFFKAAALNFFLLLILFFCLYSYLFGALYQQETSVHNLNIVWVDYDGGIIGGAVRDAYGSLQSDGFPTLIEQLPSQYPSASSLQDAVCRTDYWAALYVHAGASERLGAAVTGSASGPYDASAIMTYIWNEARYPTVVDSAIASNLGNLSQMARVAYVARNGSAVFPLIPATDAQAIATFAQPWTLSAVNLAPTKQGARTVYNTLAIVLMIIQDFFFLGTINGLYERFHIYTRIVPERILMFRFGVSGGFALLATMLSSGAIWAFRASWAATPSQWALTWLVLWIFAHQNFLTLDVFTIWLPGPYVSMALISWIVMNITSIIYPFELCPGFYRWSYALPAHAAYEALMDVWSHGCNPHLQYSLPVLFAYELSSMTLSALGTYRRCHYAMLKRDAAEEAAKAASERQDAEDDEKTAAAHDAPTPAGKAQPKAPQENRADDDDAAAGSSERDKEERDAERAQHRAQLDQARRLQAEADRPMEFGPSFHLVGSKT